VIWSHQHCIECGYFYSQNWTFNPTTQRDGITLYQLPLNHRNTEALVELAGSLACYRNAGFKRDATGDDDATINAATKARRCGYFIRYRPSYSPIDHLRLEEQREERHASLRRDALIAGFGIILGAVVARIASLL
jgi:hypothetical protein